MIISSIVREEYIQKTYSVILNPMYSYIGGTKGDLRGAIDSYLINLKALTSYSLDSYVANTVSLNERALKNYSILTSPQYNRLVKGYIRNTQRQENKSLKDISGVERAIYGAPLTGYIDNTVTDTTTHLLKGQLRSVISSKEHMLKKYINKTK